MEGFPWDDLRKILPGCQQTAIVPNGVETLPKISIAWVGHTNVTDRWQTDWRELTFTFAKNICKWTKHLPNRHVVLKTRVLVSWHVENRFTILILNFTVFVWRKKTIKFNSAVSWNQVIDLQQWRWSSPVQSSPVSWNYCTTAKRCKHGHQQTILTYKSMFKQ